MRRFVLHPDGRTWEARSSFTKRLYTSITFCKLTTHELNEEALIDILTKPKNAIVRQYQKLFEFENVRLKFSDDALEAIAALAMERKVGARGLRMILEDLMLDLMYYLPSYKKVREFLVTKEMVMTQKINMALLEKAG